MTAVVELADASVVRGATPLLSAVTWSVDESDRWVVIGPNAVSYTHLTLPTSDLV